MPNNCDGCGSLLGVVHEVGVWLLLRRGHNPKLSARVIRA